ncbi:MAG: DUF385 domain-containing protein [Myxococcales bacterium]|nr:MAG: DUF385 domain-containing protein [Myxococcales bacterium]
MTDPTPDKTTQLLLRVVKIINPAVAWLLKSPLHALASSKDILVLHFQGRKSGRWFSTPVSYVEVGGKLRVFTEAAWWRNLRDRPEARVHLRGEQRTVRAATHAGGGSDVEAAIRDFLVRVPRDARYYAVRIENGEPNDADVAAAATRSIFIEL